MAVRYSNPLVITIAAFVTLAGLFALAFFLLPEIPRQKPPVANVSVVNTNVPPVSKRNSAESVLWINSKNDLAFKAPVDWKVLQLDGGNASWIIIQPPGSELVSNGLSISEAKGMRIFLQLSEDIEGKQTSFSDWLKNAPDEPRAKLQILSEETALIDGVRALKRSETVDGKKRTGYYLEQTELYTLIAYPLNDPFLETYKTLINTVDFSPAASVRAKATIIP
ncbi:hypothetical protein EPN90_04760 [Patescibacteria group bacterium]|nr:MAG: hypothetical protein EPN90_04760 [Patescibacteria group bacterium]